MILDVQGLCRRFGDRDVLEGVAMALDAGERLALVGPNGSGKSTALRCVAGTLAPTSGRVLVGGHVAGSLGARRLVGVSLSQERSFYLRLSGRANLEFFARLRGFSRGEATRATRALVEEMELHDFIGAKADEYSTGMVLQLAFARALLGEPPLVVLDEPTRSLDKGAVARLWAALDRRPRTAVLIATHHDDDVERCHRTIQLER